MTNISTKTISGRELDHDDLTERTDLSIYWQTINNNRWAYVLLIIATVAMTLFISKRQLTYQASTTISLSPVAFGIYSTSAAVNEAITTDEGLSEVVSKAKLKYEFPDLRKRIYAENTAGTNLVTITVKDRDAQTAKEVADLLASVFIKKTKGVDPKTAKLQEELEIKREMIAVIDKSLGLKDATNNPDAATFSTTQIDKEMIEAKEERERIKTADINASEKTIMLFSLDLRIANLQEQRPRLVTEKLALLSQKQAFLAEKKALEEEIASNLSTRIIAPAIKPTAPLRPNIVMNLFFSLLAALLVGIGATLAIVRQPKDII